MTCFYSKYLSESIKHHFFQLYLSTRSEQITFEYLGVSNFQKIFVNPRLAKALHAMNVCYLELYAQQQNAPLTSCIFFFNKKILAKFIGF